MSRPPRIVIVGAGLSGLSLAFRLRERLPSADVTVLEKSTHPGGNVVTIERDGFRIEAGPNGIFDAKPHTLQLCRDLGLGDRLIPASEALAHEPLPVPQRPAPALAAVALVVRHVWSAFMAR